MIILGIDPGTRFSGYAILKKENGSVFLLKHGLLKFRAQNPLSARILEFHDNFEHIIKNFNVTDLSLETPFLGKNAQNFMKLGYLRGVLYLLAQKNKINIFEFTPREVKVAITGFGGASKEQVAVMVQRMFPGLTDIKRDDVTDALAISLCALWDKRLRAVYEKSI